MNRLMFTLLALLMVACGPRLLLTGEPLDSYQPPDPSQYPDSASNGTNSGRRSRSRSRNGDI